MKHFPRTMRLRRQREEKQRQAWKNILRPGGLLVCAPDAFAVLSPEFIADVERRGATVRSSNYIPRGMAYGLAPLPPVSLSPDYEFHLSYVEVDA